MMFLNIEEEDNVENFIELFEKVIVLRNIAIDFKNMRGLECVGINEVWINGEDKMIRRVDVEGILKEFVISICLIVLNDIVVIK